MVAACNDKCLFEAGATNRAQILQALSRGQDPPKPIDIAGIPDNGRGLGVSEQPLRILLETLNVIGINRRLNRGRIDPELALYPKKLLKYSGGEPNC